MTVTVLIIRGILDGALYAAIPIVALTYFASKLGKIIGGTTGAKIAGFSISIFCALPFFYAAYLIVKSGFVARAYADEYLVFYIMGASLVCALVSIAFAREYSSLSG